MSVLLRQPHGFEGFGLTLVPLYVSDLALAHRHDQHSVGDSLDIVPADADDPDRDDDLILTDSDDFFGSAVGASTIPRCSDNHSRSPS